MKAKSVLGNPSTPAPHGHPSEIQSVLTHSFAQGIQRILVPIDFSDGSVRALEYALRLGHDLQAKVILLHVLEGTSSHLEPGTEDNYQHLIEAEQERLSDLLRKRNTPRPATELLVRIGRASSEIPDTAKALGADLIALGAQGENPVKTMPLGSTTERVLRHAGCPVLTVR